MNIGMIGIGLMGHGIASNLVRRGHALTVLDHPGNQPLDTLRAAGAVEVVGSAREVAQRAEVLILVVTGSPQVEAVLTGPAGVLQGQFRLR
jgi:3-hydroxyisobutyrate dehydrogenase-like beta-hydroxyacid dehydrogenase